MKNYKEMANDVFSRRDEYKIAQKRKRKIITRAAVSFSCICIVALIGIGAWQSGLINTAPNATIDDSLYPGIKDTFDESKGESPDDIEANNKIVINRIDGVSAEREKQNIALMWDDFILMDKAELNEYYGLNVFPLVPEDIKEWEDEPYGIYKRDGGKGEVYWDGNVINFSNEDFSRSVNIELEKGGLPVTCYAFFDRIEEKSIINNLEVSIAVSPSGYYYAEFLYKDVGFHIIAEGISEAELITVISSIIK